MEYVTRIVKEQVPRVKVIRDPNPDEPEFELLTILHWHRRYMIHSDAECVDMSNYEADDDEELGVDREHVLDRLASDHDLVIWWPLYMIDHGVVHVRLGEGFGCPWDSGQVGIVGFTVPQWRVFTQTEWVGHEKQKTQAFEMVKAMIETLDQYMNGDMYGFEVVDDDGEIETSVWGFYGTDFDNGMSDHIDEEWHECLREALANPEEM